MDGISHLPIVSWPITVQSQPFTNGHSQHSACHETNALVPTALQYMNLEVK